MRVSVYVVCLSLYVDVCAHGSTMHALYFAAAASRASFAFSGRNKNSRPLVTGRPLVGHFVLP